MKFLDKAGSIGTVVAGAMLPCCFPFLGISGALLGSSMFLFRFQRYIPYVMEGLAVLSLLGSVLAFRGHRKIGPLVVAVIGTVSLFYGTRSGLEVNFIYAGMAALLIAAVWNTVETRRCAARCDVPA
jgi:hydrogenase/urease accessory protein HupE